MLHGYIQIPGIDGDGTDADHVGWVSFLSMTFPGGSQIASSGQSGRGIKTSDPFIVQVDRLLDGASPKLRDAIAREYQSIVIDTLGDKPARLTLESVTLRSVNSRTVGSSQFGEQVELSCKRITPERRDPPPKSGGVTHITVVGWRGFLKVPGIPGDVTETAHKDWIELRRITKFGADRPGKAVVDRMGDQKDPVVLANPESQEGAVTVLKNADMASPNLQLAVSVGKHFDYILIDSVAGDGTQQLRLEDVSITSFAVGKTKKDNAANSDAEAESVTFSYARYKATSPAAPAKKPSTHAVVRAHAAAANERSTINLRPPRFFELALPVLKGETGKRVYPPADAVVRLASADGYDQTRPISEGMITDDEYCSFRFFDISEKDRDRTFTATLEWNGQSETIFQDQRIATYIQAARKTGDYEVAFPPSSRTASTSAQSEELLAPVNGADNA